MKKTLLFLLLAFIFASCTPRRTHDYYILDYKHSISAEADNTAISLEVRGVSLPSYIDNFHFMKKISPHKVRPILHAQWGYNFRDMVRENFSMRLYHPASGAKKNGTVNIVFQEFNLDVDGKFKVEADILVTIGNENSLRHFSAAYDWTGNNAESLVSVHDNAIDEISDFIIKEACVK